MDGKVPDNHYPLFILHYPFVLVMKIRTRLSLTFVGVVAAILLLFSFVVYATAEYFRQRDFYTQLSDKAKNVARLLLDEDELTPACFGLLSETTLRRYPKNKSMSMTRTTRFCIQRGIAQL